MIFLTILFTILIGWVIWQFVKGPYYLAIKSEEKLKKKKQNEERRN